jgi:UDP-glucose 4-epimerase
MRSDSADMRSALVTGGCGFIGRVIVRQLLAKGVHVTVLDDLSSPAADILPEHENLRLVLGDVLDEALVSELTASVDQAWHLASVVGYEAVTRLPARSFDVSAKGAANILRHLEGRKAILFSSSSVYGLDALDASEERYLDETSGLSYDGGVRGYASGKQALECLAQAAASNGQDITVVRPFNVVGPGQSGIHGMVIPRFIARTLLEEPLFIYDDGLQRRSFAHVETFATAALRLAEHPRASAAAGVNIGCSTMTSILDLVTLVSDEIGMAPRIHFKPFADVFPGKTDVRDRVPVCAQLESQIGPIEWPDTRTIVRDVATWMRRLPQAEIRRHAGLADGA